MPEETSAVAEVAPAPTETPTTAVAAATKHFSDAMKVAAKSEEPKPTESVEKPVKSEPVKAKEAAKPDPSGIPEEILTGKKPEAKAPAQADGHDEGETIPAEIAKNGKARDEWKKLIGERDALRKQLAHIAPEAESKVEAEAKWKAARDRAAELETIVERSAFEQSPRFQHFLTREKAAIDSAKSYLEGSDINPNVIDLAASAKGAQRLKILRDAGMETDVIAAVAPSLDRLDEIAQDKSAALNSSKQLAEQDRAAHTRAKAERDATVRAEEDRVFAQVGADIATKFAPFQKVEGEDSWNAQRDGFVAEAKEFFNGSLPLERVAEIAYYGVGARVLVQVNQTLTERLNAANAELARLKPAQPGGGASGDDRTAAAPAGTAIDGAVRAFSREMGR